MEVFIAESKKIFIKNKLLILAAMLLIISMLLMCGKQMIPNIHGGASFGSEYEEIKALGEGEYAFQKLMKESGINPYALIFSLAVSVFAVFTEEKNEMNIILQASKHGKKNVPRIKAVIVLINIILFCTVLFFSDFLINSIKYSVPDMKLPLCTLTYYRDIKKALSFREAFLLKYTAQAVGYAVLGAMTMCSVKIFRGKTAAALTIPLASVLLPLYLGNTAYNREKMHLLPTPLSLILGGAFLQPDIIEAGTNKYIFKEIGFLQLVFTLLSVLSVGAISIFIYLRSAQNKHSAHTKRKSLTVIAVVCVLLLSGCSSNETKITFEEKNVIMIDNEHYFDTERKEVRSINATPMDRRILLFIQDNIAFWSREEFLYGGIDISMTELNTFEEKHLFTSKGQTDTTALLGLDMLFESITDKSHKKRLPRVHDDSWYCDGSIYCIENGKIKAIDLSTGEISDKLEGYDISQAKYSGGNVILKDDKKGLFKARADLKNIEPITDKSPMHFLFAEDNIYYITEENEKIIHTAYGDEIEVAFACSLVFSNEKQLILQDTESGGYFGLDIKTKQLIKLPDMPEHEFLYADENYVYFFGYDENGNTQLRSSEYGK